MKKYNIWNLGLIILIGLFISLLTVGFQKEYESPQDYKLLSDTVVTSPAYVIWIGGIDQTYTHLRIVVSPFATNLEPHGRLFMKLNNSGIYFYNGTYTKEVSNNYEVGEFDAKGSYRSTYTIELPFYRDNFPTKNINVFGGYVAFGGGIETSVFTSGFTRLNQPIESIQFSTNGVKFEPGTRVMLYGIK